MLGTSPPGLTARDFHPPSFINPRDVFRPKSRQRMKPGTRTNLPDHSIYEQSPLPVLESNNRLSCCGEDPEPKSTGCVNLGSLDAPSPDSCEGDCDKCEDCFEDHKECDEDQIKCVDNCDECVDEHEQACGQHGQVCTETCDDCDFSCFDCVDWSAFEKDKDLGLSFSVPLLDQTNRGEFESLPDVVTPSDQSLMDADSSWADLLVPPLDVSMHHQCLQNTAPFWDGILQSQFCPPGSTNLGPNLSNTFNSFGCHPATLHNSLNQQPLPTYNTLQPPNWSPVQPDPNTQAFPLLPEPQSSAGRICQWVMPCGNTCSAAFANASDLRKHVKAVHCTKGTTKCSWSGCNASFASEAALTGHISKKHLSNAQTEEDGPFKCTFPGCTKSFMYKQVLQDHLATHSGTNKTYCHICGQFLNSEGSNFRRHMASHRPKHQHMICKWHHLGCKRRFPRLDNLRRHETVCKFGKKAALHHHHYHRHVGHQA